MRTLKEPAQRRGEILDAAEQLFITKGYAKTTIIDILNAVGIAKGTLYYYYSSKEDILDAVIDRIVEQDVLRAKEIAKRTDLIATEKIFAIITAQQPKDGDVKHQITQQFHESGNAEMHQKSIVASVLGLTPILTEVVEQGISEKLFETDYPKETIEVILTSSSFLFDDGVFKWTPDEMQEKAIAFVYILEKMLGAPKHSFDFVLSLLNQ